MKPARFSYAAPESVDEAVALLNEYGDDAKVLAGGQSLIPLMNMRLASPRLLVDINRLPGMDTISTNGTVRIGALVRQRRAERSPELKAAVPIIGECLRYVGHAGIRTRGTVCGSLAHGDPAAELPTVMLALGASLEVTGKGGRREVPVEEFFQGFLLTAMDSAELLTAVSLPTPSAVRRTAFLETSRRHGDFALVGVAAAVEVVDGSITAARIALSGVADRPVLADESASLLVGRPAGDSDAVAEAAQAAGGSLRPPSDIHASGAYRTRVASVLVRRALTQALQGS